MKENKLIKSLEEFNEITKEELEALSLYINHKISLLDYETEDKRLKNKAIIIVSTPISRPHISIKLNDTEIKGINKFEIECNSDVISGSLKRNLILNIDISSLEVIYDC